MSNGSEDRRTAVESDKSSRVMRLCGTCSRNLFFESEGYQDVQHF
jgi:hypothetical protein